MSALAAGISRPLASAGVVIVTSRGAVAPAGWRLGDRVEIVRGLREGERIVVSGAFLVDSESRMKAAAEPEPANPAAKDPVCGMDVAAGAAAGDSEFAGTTYYFCSRRCEEKFEKDPGRYAGKASVASR